MCRWVFDQCGYVQVICGEAKCTPRAFMNEESEGGRRAL